MQLFPGQLALLNLRGEVHPSEREFMTQQEALQMLREISSEDFGNYIHKWEEWVEREYSNVPRKDDRG